jgi:hypothetical protein
VAASLAVLTVNADKLKAGYLDNFVPMVAETIRLYRPKVIALAEVRTELRQRFRLNLPIDSIRLILDRLRRQQLVVRTSDSTLVPDEVALDKLQFHKIQQEVLRTYDEIVSDLCEWSERTYHVKWSQEEAEGALDSFLAQYDLQVLTAQERGAAFEVRSGSDRERFLIGAYVQHLQASDSGFLDFFVSVARGSMLANAIYLPFPGRPDKRFRGTRIFLDTSILLRALGYAEPERAEPSRELLELLYEAGAQLYCFRDTLEEIRGIFDAARHAVSPGQQWKGYGQTIKFFVEQRYTPAQITVLTNRLERALLNREVRVVDRPDLTPERTIDHVELRACLQDKVDYRESALDHDTNVVQAIMSLRRGVVTRDLEECRAIFVTTNQVLVQCAREIVTRELGPGVVAPCLTEYAMTTILWLKRPIAAPDLPRKRLIADTFAATQPPDRLWGMYLRELDRLAAEGGYTEEDVLLARHSLEAREALMDVTLGDEVLVDGSAAQVLERVKQKIIGEKEAELQSVHAVMQSAAMSRQALARRIGRTVSRILTVITVLALFVVFGTASFIPVPVVPQLGRFIILVAAVAIAVYSIAGTEFGLKLTSWSRSLELSVAHRAERLLSRLAGHEEIAD